MEEHNINEEIQEAQNTVTTPETGITEKSIAPETKKCGSCNKVLFALNIVTLIAVGILFFLFFTQNQKTSAPTPVANIKPVMPSGNAVTIAYINTDSLLTQYEYAKDLEKEMQAYQKQMEDSYKSQIMAFQKEYKDYTERVGGTLTLSEQKKREEALARKQQELSLLEGKMMGQIQEKHLKENTKLLNAVYAFIRDYNENNGKFTVILKKSFADSPVLYMDSNVDLTKEIVAGLNAEYKEIKKDKK